MKLTFDFDDTEAMKTARKNFENEFRRTYESYISQLFNDGKYTIGNKPGAGYQLIKEHIETKLLEQESQELLDKIIEKNWPRILEEATDRALTHAANAIAHKAVQAKKITLST